MCGIFLWTFSAIIWPLFLVLELAIAFVFCWGLAVWAEHEISLRQVLAAPEPAPQLSPLNRGESRTPKSQSPQPRRGNVRFSHELEEVSPAARVGVVADEDNSKQADASPPKSSLPRSESAAKKLRRVYSLVADDDTEDHSMLH